MINLWQAIQEKKNEFTKSYRLIANYIEKHSREIAFLSIQELSSRIKVSTATIIRFCQEIGLSGYTEFQKEVQELIRKEYNDESYSSDLSNPLEQSMIEVQAERNIRILQEMKADSSQLNESIEEAAKKILAARRIYIMGLQGDFESAYSLHYSLNGFMDNVMLLTLGAGNLEDELKNVNEDDLLLIYSFRVYNAQMLNTINHFIKRNAVVISITDEGSPFSAFSAVSMIPKHETPSYGSVLKVTITRALVLTIKRLLHNEIDSFEKKGGYHDMLMT